MSHRSVFISKRCRCSYNNGYMVVRADGETMVHLSEINVIVVESTAAYFSSYLLAMLAEAKIPVVFCDIKHNPVGQYLPIYGSHDSSRKIKEQSVWSEENKSLLWQRIVENKIANQAFVLEGLGLSQFVMLREYADDVLPDDITNREGHAAKVYFNALFGNGFSRDQENQINAQLNYGYSMVLAFMNREIASRGYLTQLGIHHCNDFNPYNLTCDFMEPFRPVVDIYVASHMEQDLSKESKLELIALMDEFFCYSDGRYRLSSIMSLFAKTNLGILSGRLEIEDYLRFDLNEE